MRTQRCWRGGKAFGRMSRDTEMARRGKIAVLPFLVRSELNIRLSAGEKTGQILAWLNSLGEAKALFPEGINDENLLAWRKGGYQDWLNARPGRREKSVVRFQRLRDVMSGRQRKAK